MARILKNSGGRAFVASDRGCGQSFRYQNCLQVDGLDKSFGEPTILYCPSDTERGKFVEEDTIEGAESRWTSSLTNTVREGEPTFLEDIARRNCPFDIQILYGNCFTPTDYGQWSSMLMLSNVSLTNYSLSQLTTNTPDGRAAITETASISIGDYQRIYNLTLTDVTPPLAAFDTGNAGPITFAGSPSCTTDCGPITDGCDIIVQVGTSNSGLDVWARYSLDGGANWHLRDTGVDAGDGTYRMASLGSRVFFSVTVAGPTTFIYAIDTNTLAPFNVDVTQIAAVDSGVDTMLIVDNHIILGTGTTITYVSLTDGSIIEYPVTSAGTAMYHLDLDNGLYGNSTGSLFVARTRGLYTSVTNWPSGLAGRVMQVHMTDENSWLIATENGMWCTKDGGITFSRTITFDEIDSISFSVCNSLVYMSLGNAVYRSTNGGGSWTLIWNDNTIVQNDGVQNIQICPFDCNVLIHATEELLYIGHI